MPEIVPISDLRRRTRDIMDTVRESGEVYITQYGRPVAVLVDHEQYERLLRQCRDPLSPDLTGSYTDCLSGLHGEIWQDVDTDAYLQQERGVGTLQERLSGHTRLGLGTPIFIYQGDQ